jgi:tRNA(fMet)-specific endonuclease VapC
VSWFPIQRAPNAVEPPPPFDKAAVVTAATIPASLESAGQTIGPIESAGQTIGPIDTLIAGMVLAHNATLVTHYVREFSRVPDL